MKKSGRILLTAVSLSLVLYAEAFAVTAPDTKADAVTVTAPSGEQAVLTPTRKAAAEGKTLLAPPTYAYISGGKLYWGGQQTNIGVSVVLIMPEEEDAFTEKDNTFDKDKENIVIKTGKEPVDVERHIKGISSPVFRIRCIPEFSVRQQFAPSEWLEPEDITVAQLAGLGLEGWIYVPGKWYYFEGGVPHRGWLTLGNKEYYMDPETGEMLSGWFCRNEKWYYFSEENGELLKDGTTPDGYEVDKGGAWTGRMASPKKYPWQ